jgi:RNA polymerase sigma-70 factor (ECF subfamily)
MSQEDFFLIKQAKEQPAKYDFLYRKYADRVFNYFWYRTGHNKDLSEDLTQETFLRAFNDLKKFKYRGYSYFTYLLIIAHNLLVDYFRQPKSLSIEDLSADVAPYEITGDLVRKSDAESLWRAIQTLPPRHRDVLLMYYREGLSIKDIARVLNSSVNAVKLNLSRTRKKLIAHPYLQDIVGFLNAKRQYSQPKFLNNRIIGNDTKS